MRRLTVVAAVLVLAGLAACGPGSGEPGDGAPAPGAGPRAGGERPPIVLISIDTLRSDRLPAYGYAGVETPAIDALRAAGVLFARAYTPVPLTTPAHATMLTGLLPPTHGVRDNAGYRLEAAGLPYLPRLLREAGYATGGAVSAFSLRGSAGFADGFDLYDDAVPLRDRAGLGGLQRPGPETLAAVLPWLRSVADRPFFLFFHLFEPHTPYAPPAPFAERYTDPYDGEVAAADRVVGELVAELSRLGIYERAAIVLLSDHGEGLGDHGEAEHGLLLYRETLQVPLVVKLPGGARAGETVATPAHLIDVAPTLLALAGVTPPPGIEGRSLLITGGGEGADRRPLYAETYYPRLHFGWSELTSVIAGRHHLIAGPDPELYDLEADPGERRNRIAEEPAIASRLGRALAALAAEPAAPAEVDAETRRRLAALGYAGGVAAPASGPLPDPKSRLGSLEDLRAGLAAYGAGDLPAAARALERAAQANPRALDAWEYLGRSLAGLGRREEALAAYREALEVSGGASYLAVPAALLAIELGRPGEALALAEGALARDPGNPPLDLLAAQSLLRLGRADEAWARADGLVRSEPEDADALYLRGAIDIGRRRFAAAEADLRAVLERRPDHTAALADLALLLVHRGAEGEARDLLERLIALRPGDPEPRRRLAALAPAER